MPGLSIRPGAKINKTRYENFALDLDLFLQAFPAALLAKWMEKIPGNLRKKLEGTQAITDQDISVFYRRVGHVITKLKKGSTPTEIELEMNGGSEPIESSETRKIWEAIRFIVDLLERQQRIIEQLMDHFDASKNNQSLDSRQRAWTDVDKSRHEFNP